MIMMSMVMAGDDDTDTSRNCHQKQTIDPQHIINYNYGHYVMKMLCITVQISNDHCDSKLSNFTIIARKPKKASNMFFCLD